MSEPNWVYGIVIFGTYLFILFLWWLITATTGKVNYPALIKQAGVITIAYSAVILLAWAMLIASYWIGRL